MFHLDMFIIINYGIELLKHVYKRLANFVFYFNVDIISTTIYLGTLLYFDDHSLDISLAKFNYFSLQ